jgi:hypothetical protein
MAFLDCTGDEEERKLEIKLLDNLKTVRPILVFIYARLQGIAAVACIIHFVLITVLPAITLTLDIKLNYHFLIFHAPNLFFRNYRGNMWLPPASPEMLFSEL